METFEGKANVKTVNGQAPDAGGNVKTGIVSVEESNGTVTVIDANGNTSTFKLGGIPVGMVIPFAGNDNIPTGFLLCNGASVGKATYPALFAAIGYTYGGSGDYFNLPNLTDKFIEGSSTAGTVKSASVSVPNHIHAIGYNTGNNNGSFIATAATKTEVDNTVALDAKASYSRAWNGSGSSNNLTNIGTSTGAYNANIATSLPVSATSANSVTVQPPAVTMRYIIKAFEGAADNSTDLAITNVANDLINLSTKVNSHIRVVESYRDGTEWYRVWSDGWIEQGGCLNFAGETGITITFTHPFTDTNYYIGTSDYKGGSSSVQYNHHYIRNKAKTNCKIYTGCRESISIQWYACGQGA